MPQDETKGTPGFTPGPWTQAPLLSGSENDRGFRISAHDGCDGWMWIADVSPVIYNERGDASDEGKANASLIATAPELFAAASRVVQYAVDLHGSHSIYDGDFQILCAALAKASPRHEEGE